MAMVYFNRTKQIGSITIKYSNLNKDFVDNIENIIKETSKQGKIDLKKSSNNTTVTVFIYHAGMKSYFRKLFGETLVQREKYGAKAQMNIVKTDDGEIHILMGSGLSGTALTALIVAKVFEEFVETKRITSVIKSIKTIIEKNEEKEVEEELEPEEVEEEIEPEEEIIEELEETEELSEDEIVDEIEEIIEDKEVVTPDWLEDGWYKYKKGYMNQERSDDLGEYLQTHKVGKVEKMSGKSSILKEYDREYELKCTKVEYIVNTYGMNMLLKFFKNPNIKDVFKVSTKEFDDDWKEYLKYKYVSKVMEDINKTKEQKNINENIETNKQEINKIRE